MARPARELRPKRKYNVYLRTRMYGPFGEAIADFEDFVGSTIATSATKAVNNVRFRRGERSNSMYDDGYEVWYRAVAEDEDDPSRHKFLNKGVTTNGN